MVGVFSCLKDLFSVLGRDPALTDLLVEVDMIEHGNAILGEALRIDPLDPDQWLEEDKPIDEFLAKVRSLDFTDPGQPSLLQEAGEAPLKRDGG